MYNRMVSQNQPEFYYIRSWGRRSDRQCVYVLYQEQVINYSMLGWTACSCLDPKQKYNNREWLYWRRKNQGRGAEEQLPGGFWTQMQYHSTLEILVESWLLAFLQTRKKQWTVQIHFKRWNISHFVRICEA